MKRSLGTWSLRSRISLGVVILAALGFLASGLVAQSALKGYLTTQIDHELEAITGGTLPRIVRAGITNEALESRDHDDDEDRPARNAPDSPLQRIPTTTSLTLLDASGKIVGGLGGDLNKASISDYVQGLLPTEVANHGDKPFSIEADGADFRAIARALPNNGGTLVAAQSLEELDNTVSKLGFLFFFISLILLILMAVAARAVVKVGLRPLDDAETTAGEIAAGNLSARMPEASPNTEVGRLVTTLNTMLSRIEEAFAVRTESENKLRRFVADASHELRTPITAIRGFSELHRQGAVKGEAETKELIARIEGESKRMGSLVEDLLLLARLDQAREMESKPVDIVKVVADAVASAQVSGPGHPITLSTPNEELFMLGDEVRIHQVIANLLANARAHTPAGTPIAVIITSSDSEVSVSVADKGPGLSDVDQQRIFERFYRADGSRSRTGDDGSGLGLSIVDAVMRAHGGKVSVESELGKGSKFSLVFPRKES
ncbi:MAG: HAMP domain-containing sensor histidine kinase [Actinobacteria bacterium]|nr:HAMP domain-containing sensor histidine kinase [Actinomycetota bacterium]